jgi:hypothetical protein
MWLKDFFNTKSSEEGAVPKKNRMFELSKKPNVEPKVIGTDTEISNNLKSQKLQNAGMVRFNLMVTSEDCYIVPGTSYLLHNGFDTR